MAIPHNYHKDFEDFLVDYFGTHDGNMFLDDDIPDAFDNWLCKLEPDEWIELGQKYFETANVRDINNQGEPHGVEG